MLASTLPRKRIPRLLTVLGIVALCAGSTTRSCSSSSSGSGSGSSGDGGNQPDFVAELDVQASIGQASNTFQRGEPILMVLTVRNRRNETVSVDFTTTRQVDFVVVRENTDNVVWKLSDTGATPSNNPTTLDFAPGQTRVFTTIWNQLDSVGSAGQVDRGAYEARGTLVYSDFDAHPLRLNQLGSTLRRFTIN